MMKEKDLQTEAPPWVSGVKHSLDQSVVELDQPVREELARRRQQVLWAAKKNRVLKRTAWVGVAAAASVMAIMVMPVLQQPAQLAVQDDLNPLLQHMELLEDMDMLEAMGEVPGDA
jgi:hypothetical protein